MLAALRKFIKRGWHVVTEAHTAHWLYSLLPGIPSAVLGFGTWFAGQPWPIVSAIAVVVFAALFLCLLAYLGYRAKTEIPPSSAPPHQLLSDQPTVTFNNEERERRLKIVGDLYKIINGDIRKNIEYGQGIIESMQGIVRDHYISGFVNSLNTFRVQLSDSFARLTAAINQNELYSEVYGDLTNFKQDDFWEAFNDFLRVLRTIDNGPQLSWESMSVLTEPQKKSLLIQLEKMQRCVTDSKATLSAKRRAYLRGAEQ